MSVFFPFDALFFYIINIGIPWMIMTKYLELKGTLPKTTVEFDIMLQNSVLMLACSVYCLVGFLLCGHIIINIDHTIIHNLRH